jgi:type IV pilus assembly protein PilQ
LCVLLVLPTGLLQAAAHSGAMGANTLESIDYIALSGNRLRVVLTMGGPASMPTTFATDNPARIALDFVNTSSRLAARSQPIGVGLARSISVAEAQGRTRVVINLAGQVPYQTRVEGNNVVVVLGESGGDAGSVVATSSGAQSAAAASAPARGGARSLQAVDFRRGNSGEGRILVTLGNPNITVDMREEAGQIVVDFLDTNVPQELVRKLDVIDFATPVREIDTFPQGGNVRMVVIPTKAGEFEHFAYQADNLYTIELRPLSQAEVEERAQQRQVFTGERLSLNFQNIEVRAVLQLLADFTELNMVVSDTVSGNITLRLKNVPWDQALDIVLKSRGLDTRVVGNVMMVAPIKEIAAQEAAEFARFQQVEQQAPLFTELIQVNYAKASDIAKILKEGASDEGDTDSSISGDADVIMSQRGTIAIDDRTNILIVKDTAESLARIRELIVKLDVPVRQVMIESRIVIANNDFARELGVKFGAQYQKSGTDLQNGDKFATIGGAQGGEVSAGEDLVTDVAASIGGMLVNLPAPGAVGSIGLILGKAGDYLIGLELSAMQAEGRGEVISHPRVVTTEKQEASIVQGVQIPVQTNNDGTITTQFVNAALSLEVTPQITPDDRVIMDLVVSKDAPDFGNLVNGTPPIDTRSVETQVQVYNGETLVLGGVFEQSISTSVNKVPFFGDLPYIGYAFRNKLSRDDKSELLIFIKPEILTDRQTAR